MTTTTVETLKCFACDGEGLIQVGAHAKRECDTCQGEGVREIEDDRDPSLIVSGGPSPWPVTTASWTCDPVLADLGFPCLGCAKCYTPPCAHGGFVPPF